MPDTDSKKHRVLVVDDDKPTLHALETRLNQVGYDVITAVDGREGLRTALKSRPDIILLDLYMPHVSGQEMLEMLRKDSWGKTVPVIVLTNLDQSNSITNLLKEGITQYVLKAETTTDALIETIEKLLKK